ncbi:MAG: DUF45 domain-containing protein [Chloroflexi bacterium]|nr:DUF45 domain-containing protein [Chloroflexota bacterium]
MSPDDEDRMISDVCERMARNNRVDRAESDRLLLERAKQLDAEYLSGKAKPADARFSPRLTSSYGNANLHSGVIQVAERLRQSPQWVIDYLLIHEMAHLIVPGHSTEFWGLVDRYRYAERAKGYLICMSQLED